MTSIDLHKEFSRTKKEGTGGHTGSARLSPRNNDYNHNNESEFLDSETRNDLKLILEAPSTEVK
jgi:hypothetical protein